MSKTKAGNAARASIKTSLEANRLVKLGKYKIDEKALYARIIDKISGAQFCNIIESIQKDLEKENANG